MYYNNNSLKMSVDFNNKKTFFEKLLELKKDLESFRKDLEELKNDINTNYDDQDSEEENKSNIHFGDVTLACEDKNEKVDMGLGFNFNYSKFEGNVHFKIRFP